MVADMNRRDTLDSTRTLAPLKCPEDALQIDASELHPERSGGPDRLAIKNGKTLLMKASSPLPRDESPLPLHSFSSVVLFQGLLSPQDLRIGKLHFQSSDHRT